VIFYDVAPDSHYVAGRLAPADQIWVRADIRSGRTNEQKNQMLRRIMQEVGRVSGAAEDTVWVYLSEIPAANIAEYGRVLLAPGDEDAWFATLPDALREKLRPSNKLIQDALFGVLDIPPEDFFQHVHVLPRNPFRHTPAFLGLAHSDDLILLEITFISGRPKEKKLGLLKALNNNIAAAAGISPDDLMITLDETPGENISFGWRPKGHNFRS
jgi:phenylpyruvate tautomerase PptA (4-oxalocrotonate tautomerase family)